jgi:hypothetical protein
MTSKSVVLSTYVYTRLQNGIEQVLNHIDEKNLVYVPGDGLCWFYTILLGFLTLDSSFKTNFVILIEGLHTPLFKNLLLCQDFLMNFNESDKFWNECVIIIEFLKRDILKYDEIINSSLIERFGGPYVEWKKVFGQGKYEGFFHSFRVIEIYFSLIHDMHFKVQICSSNLSGLTDKYTVSYINCTTNSFSVYFNNGHYWFVKNHLDLFPIFLECVQNSNQSMSKLIEHNQRLEELKNQQEKEIDDLRKQLEFLMTHNSVLESENASHIASLQDLKHSNDTLKMQLTNSDQKYAEELGRNS